jgi:cytoskeletal protein RodZ
MNGSKLAFGLRLRAHRERRGISHETLAESLKVKRSLLTALEQGDVSRWPGGIYRRSLFREYAKAIGLPLAESLEEFCELFPERSESEPLSSIGNALGCAPFRMTLAEPPTPTRSVVYRRVSKAAVDLVLVLVIGYITALLSGSAYWLASGVVALIWYPASAVIGHHPLRRLATKAPSRRCDTAEDLAVYRRVGSGRRH